MEISCKTCIHKKVCDLWRKQECQSAKNFFEDECELYTAEQKWIPVTERLPEEHKDVLVTGVEAIGGSRVYAVKVWDSDRWRPESAPSVWWKAWMPLPEPYEEGQK